MRLLFSILFLFVLTNSFSQEFDTIGFYNSHWQEVKSISDAKYYRTACEINDTCYVVKDYYLSNQLHSIKTYRSNLKKIQHGEFIYWYENGQVKEKGQILNGYQSGKWQKFYENGALRSECVYSGKPEIYSIVDKMPEFPGGQDSLYKYLGNNLNYPAIARDSKIEGVVYVKFIVNTDGAISDVNVLKGIGGGCDEEAERVISNMPYWIPGLQDNKPVKVQFEIPLNFRL